MTLDASSYLPALARPAFRLDVPLASPLRRLLALDQLDAVYQRICSIASSSGSDAFLRATCEVLQLSANVTAADLDRIPKSGPTIVVANHPFGGAEGVVLPALLKRVRPDVKVVANFLLQRVPELRELFIAVDPFAASARNVLPLRQCQRHLKAGGVLLIFPAGEVAHLDLRRGAIFDPPWSDTPGRLALASGASVLPVFTNGRNGPLFQALGLIHPRLRTAMLIRELLNKQGSRIDVRIGTAIEPRKLAVLSNDRARTRYLRLRTHLLQHRVRGQGLHRTLGEGRPAPIVERGDAGTMQREVTSLPPNQILIDGGDQVVLIARAPQIPSLLQEVGRLREIAFRAVGEGTGKSIDLDRFDSDYLHLILWSRKSGEVMGGYRLGLTDELLGRGGEHALYTRTLFKYGGDLLGRICPAIELGRSFVALHHQKHYSPLLLLWKGIGRFIALNPRYRHVFGPVSISNSYQPLARQLMVRFLRVHHRLELPSHVIRPANAFRERCIDGWDDAAVRSLISDTDDLSDLVSDIEPTGQGIPVLLRQYLKLAAKLLAVNVDANFSDSVDALMVTDLAQTERRVLERYMGKGEAASFLRSHAPDAR